MPDKVHDKFIGAKAAIFIGDDLLVYQRDRAVLWPGYWDFAGGGREGAETPLQCLQRETFEEFGLLVSEGDITWGRAFPAMSDPTDIGWFFVVQLDRTNAATIQFGNEGQRWALLSLSDVLKMPNLVPALRDRLTHWLREAA